MKRKNLREGNDGNTGGGSNWGRKKKKIEAMGLESDEKRPASSNRETMNYI